MTETTTHNYRDVQYSYRFSRDNNENRYDIVIHFPEQDWTETLINAEPGEVDELCRKAIDQHHETSGP